MFWRVLFNLMCLQILIDGFFIYYYFPNPLLHFVKDAMLVLTYLFFMFKESFKENSNWLGESLGSGVVLTLTLFLTIGVAQVFNPQSPGLFRGILGLKITYLPLAGMLLGFVYCDREETILRLFRLIAAASIPINIFGMIQYSHGPGYMVEHFGHGFLLNAQTANIYGVRAADSFVRIIGTFASGAHYALFLAMNSVLCLALFSVDRKWKIVWYGAFALTLFALLGTGSRGGLVSAVSMIALFALFTRKTRASALSVIVTVIILAFAFSILKASVSKRFQSAANITALRERSIDTAPKQFLDALSANPMGKGIGSASQASRHLGKTQGKFQLVENYISKLQLELGIIGVLSFYLMIFLLCGRWYREWLGPPERTDSYILYSAMTAFCFVEFTVGGIFSSIDTPPASVFIWIFTGMMAKVYSIRLQRLAPQDGYRS